jgi:hypothetical protein
MTFSPVRVEADSCDTLYRAILTLRPPVLTWLTLFLFLCSSSYPPSPLQLDDRRGRRVNRMLSMRECLDLAVERCAIFFRWV